MTSEQRKLAASKPLVASSLVLIFESIPRDTLLVPSLMPSLFLLLFLFFFLNVAVMTNLVIALRHLVESNPKFGHNHTQFIQIEHGNGSFFGKINSSVYLFLIKNEWVGPKNTLHPCTLKELLQQEFKSGLCSISSFLWKGINKPRKQIFSFSSDYDWTYLL